MFSGIGGFEYGIHNAYLVRHESKQIEGSSHKHSANASSKNGIGGQQRPICVGYSEIDKYAIKVYERNFGEDIRPIQQESATPEQDSDNTENELQQREHSNNRGGHTNYGDATTINPNELPDFDLLVGGFPCQAFSIAGKRKGFDDTRGTLFFDIARILAEKKPKHLVLENVKGLLSHEQGRTFQTIIGVLSDLGYGVEWQVLNSKDFGVPQNRERVIIVGHLGGECTRKVFPITGANGQDIVQLNQPKHSNDRIYSSGGVSPTLNTMQGGNRQPFIEQPPRIRRLTPLECERLQGFPDNWTALDQDGQPISDTQRYKMCGNAVTTNVIQAVMEQLCV